MSMTSTNFIRIAVVDDDPIILKVFEELIKKVVYQADFFSSPHAFLEKVREDKGHYHLVVSDVQMPGLDGISFAKELRLLMPSVPILFMTGVVHDSLKEAVVKLGNAVLMEKPFPVEATLLDLFPKIIQGSLG